MAKRKKKTTDLDYWLGNTVTPVFVLDPERCIRAFNRGCQALTGWSAADVIGEMCHYASLSELAGAGALAASLCPPPEVFTGEEASAPANLVHQEGHALPRMLHFFPLRDEKGESINHPANVDLAHRALAELRGLTPEALAGQVAENFARLFGNATGGTETG